LPWDGGWLDNREGNTESEYKIQIQYPESIQDSYEYVQSDWNNDDVDNPVEMNGTLSFIMPAENVTLNIDLIENPDYIAPPVETELTIVNNLPEGYTCEVAKLSGVEGDEEPVPIEDINSNITLYQDDEVFVKVFNENNEPVNYFNDADMYANSYSRTHESSETMRTLNVYCSIEGDFNDEITTDNLGYDIWGQTAAAGNFGYGENFTMPSIPLTLTIQKP
jgi:hypothetical protein